MPSSRRKKELRATKLTHSFFNQGTGARAEHASSSKKADNTAASTEAFEKTISSIWKERYGHLTTEEHKGVSIIVTKQKVILHPHAVLERLRFAHSQGIIISAEDYMFLPMEGFDLGNLDKVAEEYGDRRGKYKQEEEISVATLDGLVGEYASIAKDETRSPEDRLAAELDIHTFNVHSKIVLPLIAGLSQVQLFNIEKRWGFVEESYQELSNNDNKQRGQDGLAKLEPSFRQKLNNPFEPTEPPTTPSKTRGKKEKKKKNLSATEALMEIQRNSQLVIEEMREINNNLSCLEEPVKMPVMPPSFNYIDIPVPKDLPDHVRQRFFDAESALQQVLSLEDKAAKQLLEIRSAFVAWYSASHDIWEAGKKRMHEMPLFREYEYTRVSIHALFSVTSRQEVKIAEFYHGQGASEVSLAMNDVFKLKSMSPEEFQKDWDQRRLKLQKSFPSVDKMVAGIDSSMEEISKTDSPKTEWWKWLKDDPQ